MVSALAVLLVAVPPAAAAGLKKFRMGVVEGNLTNGDLRTIGRTGSAVLRFNFSWDQAEVIPCSRYDWSNLDRVVRESSAAGYRLLPIITDSPSYVSGTSNGQQSPHTRDAADIRAYTCFVREAAERYGRGGEFTATPGIKPIIEWQVWNEPSLRSYAARGQPDPREYARLLQRTHRTITGQDQRAKIILAGMPEVIKRGMNLRPYLRGLYRVPRIEQSFDALGLHAFGETPAGVRGSLIRLQRLLRKVGDRRRAVWVTEISWSTGGQNPWFIVTNSKGQARNLRQTFKMLRANRRRFNIGTVTWIRWRDTASSSAPDTNAFAYSGLYRRDGHPKRSCNAFARLAGGSLPCRQIDDGPTAMSSSQALLAPREASSDLQPSPSE